MLVHRLWVQSAGTSVLPRGLFSRLSRSRSYGRVSHRARGTTRWTRANDRLIVDLFDRMRSFGRPEKESRGGADELRSKSDGASADERSS